jgi:hypothetical protein
MGELLVRRPGRTRGTAWFRRIKVTVDGVVVARLRPGDETRIELPGAPCWVEAHLDFTHSEPLRLKKLGQTEQVAVEVNAPAAVGMVAHRSTYLTCRRVPTA